MKTTSEIRRSFLDFFEARGHAVVPSSPLVPANDPTLLFTNAGMVQFKDIFLGREQAPYPRAVSSQRCVRAGGKHNDLENVGYTARHHTFFEMLGNFSFGDYFKREAIAYAWEFVTGVAGLPPEKLWVTVYEDDDEAAEIWLNQIGVAESRFARIAGADNFWTMGEVGPCGPCTEIFYDHGAGVAGGPPGSDDSDGDRYVELWNLVFMQHERGADGELRALPKPSVDTGMGLERLAAVLQGTSDNYGTDLFRGLIQEVADLAGADARAPSSSLKVIADHIRSCSFLMTDGVVPSNEGRGYVLRRIIRRALRHGRKLGVDEVFFHRLVAPLAARMGDAFPELAQAQTRVAAMLRDEEERFSETLSQGLAVLEENMAELSSGALPGDLVFKLYDTYGFPVDLTADIAREKNLALDYDGFEQLMRQQKDRARRASRFAMEEDAPAPVEGEHSFSGYDTLQDSGRVIAMFRGGEAVEALESGEHGAVILDNTPFYAEAGGQVGDSGLLSGAHGAFRVEDTRKAGRFNRHTGVVEHGRCESGETMRAQVDAARRAAIVRNHSATHLLHAALKQVLGAHVEQKGSLVAAERLRFDFSHGEPVGGGELRDIERLVNEKIRDNIAAETEWMPKQEALGRGAVALFGEKYDDTVRVLTIGDFSVELCGGTHVRRTGDIGLFKITAESGVAAGVRRIEALTGAAALEHIEARERRLDEVCRALKVREGDAAAKAGELVKANRRLQKAVETEQARAASGAAGGDLAASAVEVEGVRVLAARVENPDPKSMRALMDGLKNRLGTAAIVLAAVDEGRVKLIAGVTGDTTARVEAGPLVNAVARQVKGRGGGRADMAEAGGSDPEHLDAALASVPEWVREQMRA